MPGAFQADHPGAGNLEALGIVSAKKFGAVGDGDANDTEALQEVADYCFGSASDPHGRDNVHLNKVLMFPPGKYKTTAPLLFTNLMGAKIVGSGRHVTLIHNVGTGSDNTVLRTNGMGYSSISDLSLQCHEDGICLDLDWDGEAGPNGSGALQANTFSNLFCYGSSEDGTIGVRIAQSTFMGSECIFNMLHNQECRLAGVIIGAFNALQHQFYGGQDQACGVGIWSTVGSAPIISGRGFQAQTVCDIKTSGGQHNSMSITGCRTESRNFVINEGGQALDIAACVQTAVGEPGYFVQSVGGFTHIRACETNAAVNPYYWCKMTIDGCDIAELQMDPGMVWYVPNNSVEGNVFIRNAFIGGTEICEQRRFTTDGLTITTIGDVRA